MTLYCVPTENRTNWAQNTNWAQATPSYLTPSETPLYYPWEPYKKYSVTATTEEWSGCTLPLNVSNYTTINYTTTNSIWEPIILSTTYLPIEHYSWATTVSKQDIERERLRNNLVIQIKSRANSIQQYPGESEPERKALETLREIISEEDFRKYLRYGFVLVKGKSGATYQIFRNASHCKVWLNGQVIEEVCVRIKNEKVPKTDKIIAFKTIIETSEEQFKKLGNVYKMTKAA